MSHSELLTEVQKKLVQYATAEARLASMKFVPNTGNVYGVRMPVLNDMAKDYAQYGFQLIEALWKSGAYEERMLAVKLLSRNCRKDPDYTLRLVEDFSLEIDNWAVCDTLCSEAIRPILKLKNKEIWNLARTFLTSEKMWIRRMGIVTLIHFAKIPDRKPEVRALIQPLQDDKEYYIKKAITWITRYLDK